MLSHRRTLWRDDSCECWVRTTPQWRWGNTAEKPLCLTEQILMTNMGGLQGSRWSCRDSQLLQLGQKWPQSLPVKDWSPMTLLGGGELSRDGDGNWWDIFAHKKPFPWRGLWGGGLLSLFASWPLWAEQLAPTMNFSTTIAALQQTWKLQNQPQSQTSNPPTLRAKVNLVSFSSAHHLGPCYRGPTWGLKGRHGGGL